MQTNECSDIAQIISASAEGETENVSPIENNDARKVLAEEMRQIPQAEYEVLLRYILLTIAVIGVFLIAASMVLHPTKMYLLVASILRVLRMKK